MVAELPKYTRINNYAIELVDDWQSPYGFIYRLGPVELETLKTYIENNLASDFIKLSKFLARAPIFINKKSDKSLKLYVDYWGLNNLIIKNQYLLSLVNKLLDWLGRARYFTQLNLINAYY